MSAASPAAARLQDPVAHSHALGGFLAGAALGLAAAVGAAVVIGAVVGAAAAEVASAGLATPLVVGAVATVGEFGLNAVVGGKLMGLAEEEGQALGASSLGAASGAISAGSPNVRVNGLAAARALDPDSCDASQLAQGSRLVAINGRPASRVGDKTTCGAVVSQGSPNVVIGGPAATMAPIQSEVPSWARWAVVVAGLLPALGGLARTIGPAIAEVEASGFTRAAQTGVKALGRALEERAGGGAPGVDPAAPSATAQAVSRMSPEFQAEYAQAEAAGWKKPDGTTWYPPNNGGVGTPTQTTVDPPAQLDRFGGEKGSYLSASGDSFESRALPGMPDQPPNNYVVQKPMPVEQSEIAPWFGQPGGGTQYRLVSPDGSAEPYSVRNAINDGYMVKR